MVKNQTKIKIILGILLLSTFRLSAQVDNKNLENNFAYRDSSSRKVQFSFNSLLFVHNREYFNNIADGYTMMGYWLNPKIAFQPSKKVLIEGGVFLRKEIGLSGIAEVEPTFTIKIKNENWSYLFGNLEGNLSHRLIEPLMDFERALKNPLEHGLQAKYSKNTTFFDSWLDYQQSTIAGLSRQEHFFGGFSYTKSFLKLDKITINGIAQSSIYHKGGQNLVNNPLPVRTLLNPAFGLQLSSKNEALINLKFTNYFVGYFEGTKHGTAFYSTIQASKNTTQVILSYWNSTNFISPMGGDLYQSASREFGMENYYETKRELLFLKFVKEWKVMNNMVVSLRIEPYYDFKNQLFEHAEGIYLKYGI